MPIVPGVHRANHAQIVDDLSGVRQQLRNLGPAVTVLHELKRRAEQLLAGSIDEAIDNLAGIIGPVEFRQLRLRIEQIHVRRSAVHEQRDHRPGLRFTRRLLRL